MIFVFYIFNYIPTALTFINCPTFVGGDAAISLYPRPVGLTDHSTHNLQRVVTIWAAVSARSYAYSPGSYERYRVYSALIKYDQQCT